MHWFHKWGNWVNYDRDFIWVNFEGPIAGKEIRGREMRQQRTCKTCGKKQDEKIRGGAIDA
jgi:hypothetical protein